MSSNDKTSDLLVATTRATKGDSTDNQAASDATKPATTAATRKKVASKKAPAKKAPAKKASAAKAPAKKTANKKATAKPKVETSQKAQLIEAFSRGGRVWPD